MFGHIPSVLPSITPLNSALWLATAWFVNPLKKYTIDPLLRHLQRYQLVATTLEQIIPELGISIATIPNT